MIRKLLFSASLAGLLVLGLSAQARTITTQSQSEKQSQAAKSVSGKVTSIGNGGHSFTLEVSGDTSNKRSMDFVVDKNTQVQGQVREGTPVTVEYQAMENGQYLALSITAQA
jgi:hypothetical protein